MRTPAIEGFEATRSVRLVTRMQNCGARCQCL